MKSRLENITALFSSIPDPRKSRGSSYKLPSLLALLLLGVLCGRRGCMAIFRLGRSLSHDARRTLGFGYRVPCHSTLTELVRDLDADVLAEMFGRVRLATAKGDARHLAMDGKTMRGSKDEQGKAMHCVSVFCAELMQVAGHTASRGKGLEIPDALALLAQIDLTDKIVTGDALMCQKSITTEIIEGGGDYVLPVKNNQKTLRENIETAFTSPEFPPVQLARTGT